MIAYFTIKNNLKLDLNDMSELTLAARITKNIYNVSLYILRQEYFKTQKLLSIGKLYREVRKNSNYQYLNPKISDDAISKAYGAMKVFISFSNKNEKLRLPKYKGKYSLAQMIISKPIIENNKLSLNVFNDEKISSLLANKNINDSLIEEFVNLAKLKSIKEIKLTIPKIIKDKEIVNLKIKPEALGFNVLITYSDNVPITTKNHNKALATDLGIKNLAACVTSDLESFIIDGAYLKSIIRLYKKKIGNLESNLELEHYTSKRIIYTYNKMVNRVDDYLNKAVKLLFKKIIELHVDTIIIGWNEHFKEFGIKNTSISKYSKRKINQMFTGVPLAKFRDKILTKAKKLGLNVVINEEKYTSKASFFDNDPFVPTLFTGNRIIRGLYERENKLKLNADINGALNIYRKYAYRIKSTTKLEEMLKQNTIKDPLKLIVKI